MKQPPNNRRVLLNKNCSHEELEKRLEETNPVLVAVARSIKIVVGNIVNSEKILDEKRKRT